MKIITDVPIWMVLQVTRREGQHQARLRVLNETDAKKRWRPMAHYNSSGNTGWSDRYRAPDGCVATGSSVRAKDLTGNLGNEEYRYFIGKPFTESTFAMCRYCRESFWTLDGRRGHSGPHHLPCSKLLVRAYEMLSKDKCVCCDKRASKHTWGLAFCSDSCVNAWKFSETEAAAFANTIPGLSLRLHTGHCL